MFRYILKTSVYQREPESMKDPKRNIMTISANEGEFLNMLLKLINAKNTMEIAVYIGYSLLATAFALHADSNMESSAQSSGRTKGKERPTNDFESWISSFGKKWCV
ncbi:caffeoyl-CoA O-methyltransferase-like isoform X2 [Actinidia eriantha]|uniref:caffeoyl-CoA O-methyltransferase-like isoform X2 n=1 Tax=Actinidia eriantha TaxID=165200 RepID=UPI00258D440F|nr:caffeoyl-CoA O-methyltransferase-like isoform X2 [Actinidia eriantha]